MWLFSCLSGAVRRRPTRLDSSDFCSSQILVVVLLELLPCLVVDTETLPTVRATEFVPVEGRSFADVGEDGRDLLLSPSLECLMLAAGGDAHVLEAQQCVGAHPEDQKGGA